MAKTKTHSQKRAENDAHTRETATRKPLTFLISFLIDLFTIQGGVMTNLIAIRLDKYKKDYVEVHPEVDKKGEFAELQVLEEVFDSDQCLDQLERNKRPQCPRHMTHIKFSSIRTHDGSTQECYIPMSLLQMVDQVLRDLWSS